MLVQHWSLKNEIWQQQSAQNDLILSGVFGKEQMLEGGETSRMSGLENEAGVPVGSLDVTRASQLLVGVGPGALSLQRPPEPSSVPLRRKTVSPSRLW